MKRTLSVLSILLVIGAILTGCGFFDAKGDARLTKEPTASNIAIKPDETTKNSTKDSVDNKEKSSNQLKKSSTDNSDVKPTKNNPTNTPSPASGYVTINPNSPYPDYCEILVKYLNQKFDPKLFKHITIEDLQMYAKQMDPYEYGEVILNVEHIKGKTSKYKEGKNKMYIRLEIHPDGSKNLDALDFNPIH